MSTLSVEEVEKILGTLQRYFDADSLEELAQYLGYNRSSIYKWKEKKNVPAEKLVRKFPQFSYDYLSSGTGDLLLPLQEEKIEKQDPLTSGQADLARKLDALNQSVRLAITLNEHVLMDDETRLNILGTSQKILKEIDRLLAGPGFPDKNGSSSETP